MSNGDSMIVHGNYSIELKGLKDAESGLKFFQTTFPRMSIQTETPKAWGQGGKVQPTVGGGHQVTWSPVTLTRYVDDSTALYDWAKAMADTGSNGDGVKQAPTITLMDNDQPLWAWSLTDAVPSEYGTSDANAQAQGLMTETITITYASAERKSGGG
jgi:phage tail-like protein